MSDPQRPKPPAPLAPSFEIPDLELELGPRVTPRSSPRPSPQASPAPQKAPESGGPSLFDEDAFSTDTLSLDLDHGASPAARAPVFGSSLDFGDTAGFELEPVASPG